MILLIMEQNICSINYNPTPIIKIQHYISENILLSKHFLISFINPPLELDNSLLLLIIKYISHIKSYIFVFPQISSQSQF